VFQVTVAEVAEIAFWAIPEITGGGGVNVTKVALGDEVDPFVLFTDVTAK
jgi:hypothetical protein